MEDNKSLINLILEDKSHTYCINKNGKFIEVIDKKWLIKEVKKNVQRKE